jgi:CubicO group peptidase (beta-lactamase class C family)
MRFLSLAVAVCACACGALKNRDDGGTAGGGGGGFGGGAGGGASLDWAPVEAAVRSASADAGVPDLALYVYRGATDERVFTLELGAFRSSTNIAVASASKWISAMVIFDVIRRGQLSLDSTTGQVLGWTGPNAAITLRHLLSFTSGLDADANCTRNPLTTLQACVATIAATSAIADAGTRYDYGSTHLHVAARMAEVATGKSWDLLFDEVLRQPLQLSSAVRYYTFPMQSTGMQNPLIAGGLRVTTDEYAKLLGLEFHKGVLGGVTVGTTALFDAQAIEPFPSVTVGNTPVGALGYAYRYGLSAWLECATPAAGCQRLSSPGAFGFTPWIDREHGYYAILAMEVGGLSTGVVSFSVELAQAVQPLIVDALK